MSNKHNKHKHPKPDPTTTTEQPTTTTQPEVEVDDTTTTEPEDTTTTVVVDETPETGASSTYYVPTVEVPPAESTPELPATGVETFIFAAAGLLFVLAGRALVRLARRDATNGFRPGGRQTAATNGVRPGTAGGES